MTATRINAATSRMPFADRLSSGKLSRGCGTDINSGSVVSTNEGLIAGDRSSILLDITGAAASELTGVAVIGTGGGIEIEFALAWLAPATGLANAALGGATTGAGTIVFSTLPGCETAVGGCGRIFSANCASRSSSSG